MRSPVKIAILIVVVLWGCTNSPTQKLKSPLHFSLTDSVPQNPIALIYIENEYHLFFNYSNDEGIEKWGLAESKDLFHWTNKSMNFQSSEVGEQNIKTVGADWAQATKYSIEDPALFAFGTVVDRFGQLTLFYSNDKGMSWKQEINSPIILADFYEPIQDLKVIWNDEQQKWIMLVLSGYEVRFYSSDDLQNWEYLSRFGDDVYLKSGEWTGIDFFPMEEEKNQNTKWVLFISADSGSPNEGSGVQYFVGDFDGYVYQASHNKPKWIDHGSDLYQAVVLSDYGTVGKEPVMIGSIFSFIYKKFNIPVDSVVEFSLPRKLILQEVFYDYYLPTKPIVAGETDEKEIIVETELKDGYQIEKSMQLPFQIDLTFDVNSRLYLGMAESFGVRISNKAGNELIMGYQAERRYFYIADPSIQQNFPDTWDGFYYAPYVTNEPSLDMTLIIDKNSAELFAMNGLITLSRKFDFSGEALQVKVFAESGSVTLKEGVFTPF